MKVFLMPLIPYIQSGLALICNLFFSLFALFIAGVMLISLEVLFFEIAERISKD